MSGYDLVMGGAGFVGTNLADRLLREGRRVRVFDSLARPGVEANLGWLRKQHPGDRLDVMIGDVRNVAVVRDAVARADTVYHLAAQVAVSTSVTDPGHDFEVNARGTVNLLEAVRQRSDPPPLFFTSTNKVYGVLRDVALRRTPSRYEPLDPPTAERGIDESRPLAFRSPYGCSKGAADQYVLDYAHTYGLPTVVFRMSCIYGPHQHGTEDQGWVAHFLIRALQERPITLYGDGRQVRDILFVDDLVEAFLAAHECMDETAGRPFNIGGGSDHAVSLLELIDVIVKVHRRRPRLFFEDWRVGDQRYYVSDHGRFRAATGWVPAVGVQDGVARLYEWLRASLGMAAAPEIVRRAALRR